MDAYLSQSPDFRTFQMDTIKPISRVQEESKLFFLSHDTVSIRSSLREGRFVLAHGFRVSQSIMTGEAWLWEVPLRLANQEAEEVGQNQKWL